MIRTIILIIFILMLWFLILPSIIQAHLGYRAYYPATGLKYPCVKLSESQSTFKKTCTSYNATTGKYTARTSNIIIQREIGVVDSTGTAIYEGDVLMLPGQNDVVVEYNTTNRELWLGWVLHDTVNLGAYYPPLNEYGLKLLNISKIK